MAHSTDCIVWTRGTAGQGGYGSVYLNGRRWYVHRLEWEKHYGPIPDGMQVCHHCDNPPCYNIDHLFLGTRSDNMRDAAAKNRNGMQRKTHCVNGHPYPLDAGTPRRCPICRTSQSRAAKARRKAARVRACT